MDELLRETRGVPLTNYGSFQKVFASVVKRSPIKLAPTPERIPPPAHAGASECAERAVPTVAELAPSLAGAGDSPFPGGEREGLRRLSEHLARDSGRWAAQFEKPKTSPTELDPFGENTRSTTVRLLQLVLLLLPLLPLMDGAPTPPSCVRRSSAPI